MPIGQQHVFCVALLVTCCVLCTSLRHINPLTPTVAILIQLQSIFCQTGFERQSARVSKITNDGLTWSGTLHRMLYSCTHMATVDVKGLTGRVLSRSEKNDSLLALFSCLLVAYSSVL